MSLVNSIPVNSIPIQTETSFEAEFSNPTLNKYNFSVPANNNVPVLTLRKNSVYYIDRLNFSCDADEGDFKKSIDRNNPLILILKTLKTNKPIYPQPLPFINYVDNLEFQFYFDTGQSNDELQATFQGQLFQAPGLVGDMFISALVQMNIYQVTDTNWLKNYKNPRGTEQGENLALRGF